MNNFITFMLAPALGCLLMSFIFTYFGIHVLKRGIVFIDLSMAQLAALGTTVAFALNLEENSPGTIFFFPLGSYSSELPFSPWCGF